MYRYRAGRWDRCSAHPMRSGVPSDQMIADAQRRAGRAVEPGHDQLDRSAQSPVDHHRHGQADREGVRRDARRFACHRESRSRARAWRAAHRPLPMASILGLRARTVSCRRRRAISGRCSGKCRADHDTRLRQALSDGRYVPPAHRCGFPSPPGSARPADRRDRPRHRPWRRRTLWFATQAGTVWIDPAKIAGNPVPPGWRSLHRRSARRYRDPKTSPCRAVRRASRSTSAALSLSIPELVKVRYRLEGVDHDWIDPGKRRQAFYTNPRTGAASLPGHRRQ